MRLGTIQIDVRVEQARQLDDFRVNAELLGSYERQLREIGSQIGKQNDVSWEALLTLPGVVEEQRSAGVDLDAEWGPIKQVTQEALQNLAEMRAGEGRAMGADLEANCQAVAAELTKIESRAPHVSDGYRTRLTERVKKLLGESEVRVGPDDVIREVALFAERSDISEELVRLHSHLDQFRQIMELSESNGRKLEFVTQEMFRESNTIGSKANDS